MRKTKIICTLGPATDKEEVLRQLMLEGMNNQHNCFLQQKSGVRALR